MFVYEKRLQYPVHIQNPNPKLAAAIISQYGGPNGGRGRKAGTAISAFRHASRQPPPFSVSRKTARPWSRVFK